MLAPEQAAEENPGELAIRYITLLSLLHFSLVLSLIQSFPLLYNCYFSRAIVSLLLPCTDVYFRSFIFHSLCIFVIIASLSLFYCYLQFCISLCVLFLLLRLDSVSYHTACQQFAHLTDTQTSAEKKLSEDKFWLSPFILMFTMCCHSPFLFTFLLLS